MYNKHTKAHQKSTAHFERYFRFIVEHSINIREKYIEKAISDAKSLL